MGESEEEKRHIRTDTDDELSDNHNFANGYI